MKKLLLLMCLIPIIGLYAREQDEYDIMQSYREKETLALNKTIKSDTTFELFGDEWTVEKIIRYNTRGLPIWEREGVDSTKYIYAAKGQLSSVKKYWRGSLSSTSEFKTNASGKITSVTRFWYDEGRRKIESTRTFLYGSNSILFKAIKLGSTLKDTIEINWYDSSSGLKTRWLTYENKGMVKRTEYIWNANQSEMKERVYIKDTISYTTLHTYADGNEIKQADSSSSDFAFYFKYDNKKRITEMNLYEVVQYYEYDNKGYLAKMYGRRLNLFCDYGDCPPFIEFFFKHKYSFRN